MYWPSLRNKYQIQVFNITFQKYQQYMANYLIDGRNREYTEKINNF